MEQDSPVKILFLEDSQVDAELNERSLRKAGIVFTGLRVEDRNAFVAALDDFKPDIILADYNLPGFNGLQALEIARQKSPLVPYIFVTGSMGEERAVSSIKQGATDYIIKDRLARLPEAVQRALEEAVQKQQQREGEERFRVIFENALDGIVLVDESGLIHSCNPEFERQTGRSQAELKQCHIWALRPADKIESAKENFQEISRAGGGEGSDLDFQRPDGEIVPVEFRATIVAIGGKRYLLSISRDITERKRAEKALLESEARYRRITEGLTDYQYTVHVEQGRAVKTTQSPACVTVTGYRAEEFVANPDLWIQMVAPSERAMVMERVGQILAGKDVPPIEHHIIRKDGASRWVSDTTILFKDASGNLLSYDGVIKDITERKLAEIALDHATRALATLSMVNRQLVYATDESALLHAICQAIVEQRGYLMASVGYVQQDAEQTIKIMAHAGDNGDYLRSAQLSWADNERGQGPSGRAVRSRTTQLCQDIAHDPKYLPWRDAALQHGYAASIALPLINANGEVFGILSVYAEEANAFSPREIDLLEEMAGDMAFGVRSLNIRHERDLAVAQNQHYLEELRDNLEDAVRAIAATVEMRDPYTAGHQGRVAKLAAAIATQMGLPEEQVHSVHLAGIVHDLGKIRIPAEILSKPGLLSDIEYSLIKTHPPAGYDILKGIDFPWPIAQMVRQHHERLDGSGYPQGLKGDAILLEARILAVADVVEAMSSHRPYRPGLGLDSALAEITRLRGTSFDADVVDACLTLFRDKHYMLSE
ncbi:MAG TPA: HD domain-containing phosphohydrolase [Gallionella sp.]|nr:HD domain-containing phosphohydrolase [Gallionella sp.]